MRPLEIRVLPKENTYMVRYLSLRCELPPELEDELPAVLDQFPVLGSLVEQTDDGTVAIIFMDSSLEGEVGRLTGSLTDLGIGKIVADTVDDEDWIAAYRRTAQPFSVGRSWWIDPGSGGSAEAPAKRIRLVIEPSVAFGSGSHDSTQLLLEALEELGVAGASVLDVGTGSGILALAADALGARMVVGLDVDPVAVWTARRTARNQAWNTRVLLIASPVTGLAAIRFDLVLCNMISSEFAPLMCDLARLLAANGRLVLSGAVDEERATVHAVVENAGLRVLRERRRGEWMSLTVRHA